MTFSGLGSGMIKIADENDFENICNDVNDWYSSINKDKLCTNMSGKLEVSLLDFLNKKGAILLYSENESFGCITKNGNINFLIANPDSANWEILYLDMAIELGKVIKNRGIDKIKGYVDGTHLEVNKLWGNIGYNIDSEKEKVLISYDVTKGINDFINYKNCLVGGDD